MFNIHRTEQLLRPARPLFIAASLLVALCLHALPMGQVPWFPDVMLLVLCFWALHQPQRVGIGTAFVLGVAVDVLHASLLGQHALAYIVAVFWVQTVQNRLRWYQGGMQQAILLLLPFFCVSLLQACLGWLSSRIWPSSLVFLAPLLQALLWPLVRHWLLAPQLSPLTEKERRPL
ncbi:rod shape-determining protein MreD [Vandammella animalimorsus]|uniref:rod shape-determining protein MreD n=1 Tax=Vandammella animalimorsus TaxID=2029117 RepID=UPI0031BA93D6